MKRLGLLVVAGVLAVALSIAAKPAGPPEDGEAKPPHHAKHLRGGTEGISGSTSYYEPKQVRHAYGFDLLTNGGTGQIIGIVDAYDDPTVANDLQTFIANFGLPSMNGLPNTPSCTVAVGPHPCFQKVYAQGSKPGTNGGWALEISLDVQWAHAIAPGADILLVEAANSSFSNLLGAVDVAVNGGAKVVSMSWGGSEFSSESSYDFHFNKTGVTFTAASGDSGTGPIYPAVSPYVVAVGGTTLPLDLSGNLTGPETAWSGSGGGISPYEAEPGYQSSYPIPNTGGKRGNPDVSYDADPNTAFLVYDSTPYLGATGWWAVGGTSAGAPQWAALVVLADQARSGALSSNNLTSSPLYNAAGSTVYASNYRDITSGTNGSCGFVCTATTGYDFVTGLGSPLANNLMPFLAGTTGGGTTTTGSITGMVSDASTNSAIAGATVSVDTGQSTTTTTNGSYTLAGVSTGSRTVTASASGYQSASQVVSVTSGGTVSANFVLSKTTTATKVVVSSISYATSGKKSQNLLITVALKDDLGNPVGGASVSINAYLNGALYGAGTGSTGADGTVTFSASNAPCGTYTTKVTSIANTTLTWDGTTPANSYTKC